MVLPTAVDYFNIKPKTTQVLPFNHQTAEYLTLFEPQN